MKTRCLSVLSTVAIGVLGPFLGHWLFGVLGFAAYGLVARLIGVGRSSGTCLAPEPLVDSLVPQASPLAPSSHGPRAGAPALPGIGYSKPFLNTRSGRSSKLIPPVVVPTVTATGVPAVIVQDPPGQGMLSNSSSMYPSELNVAA